MTDVMVDLETLSTSPNACILTIGAVKFCRRGPVQSLLESRTFYRRIDVQSCIKLGLDISKETQDWWNTQSKAAQYEAFEHKERVQLKEALVDFARWFRGARHIWSHGDDFDCVILSSAYEACGLDVPWKFWSTRDTRTLFDLANINIRDFPIKEEHHALYDAYRQVLGVRKGLVKLEIK